jgi:hypothetical protein
MRYVLLGLYLAANRLADVTRILSAYPDEERRSASFGWARVMEQWLSGNLEGAVAALARARKVNPFAEPYISGARATPAQAPEYYRPDDESGAQVCARELAPALASHPDFRRWLREKGQNSSRP